MTALCCMHALCDCPAERFCRSCYGRELHAKSAQARSRGNPGQPGLPWRTSSARNLAYRWATTMATSWPGSVIAVLLRGDRSAGEVLAVTSSRVRAPAFERPGSGIACPGDGAALGAE